MDALASPMRRSSAPISSINSGPPREALANKAVIHSLRSELFQMYVFSAG
jgi:hypothetical protein